MAVKSVKFEQETLDKLNELARIRDRDVSYLIREAVNDLIDKTAWQIEEVEKTLEGIDSGEVSTRPLGDFLTEAKESLSKKP
ncbi:MULTISPECIES: CopG family ribbon-helix-helix protein [unclassified Endozoicomonas]|nr:MULTISPECIES: ribbon-helix-helix protein, CopG family [unclassified Endozoicomonas]